jgi:hypothetical protein
MNSIKSKINKIVLLFLLALPSVVLAQLRKPDPVGNLPDLSNNNGVTGLAIYIVQALLAIGGITAVLFVMIGGYQYLFSGANEELAERGKKTLTNAVIGVVIIILSFTIVSIIYNTLLSAGNAGCSQPSFTCGFG